MQHSTAASYQYRYSDGLARSFSADSITLWAFLLVLLLAIKDVKIFFSILVLCPIIRSIILIKWHLNHNIHIFLLLSSYYSYKLLKTNYLITESKMKSPLTSHFRSQSEFCFVFCAVYPAHVFVTVTFSSAGNVCVIFSRSLLQFFF